MTKDMNHQRRGVLHDADGKAISVPLRDGLPSSADRVRYPGFKQEKVLLKQGTVRMPGYQPLPCDMIFERDVPIKLDNGNTIYTDVFRPNDDQPHPAIMSCSPYGKEVGGQWIDDVPHRAGIKKGQTSGLHKFEGPDPAYWVPYGYAIVNPDLQGAFKSEGFIHFFGNDYGREGAQIIEWIASQPWSNKKVGMSGNSWLAISQWFVAAQRPKHLAAIAPWEGLNNAYTEVGTHGGVPTAEFVEILTDTFASDTEGIEDCISAMQEHPLMDDYWRDKIVPLEKINTPAYIVASYTNFIHTYGTFEGWRRISSSDKWLRVHNNQEWHDYYQKENEDDLRKFFDYYLANKDNDWKQTPKVRLSVLNPGGKDIINRPENEFPLARTKYTKLYLNNQNKKLQLAPEKSSQVLVYNSDDAKHRSVTYKYRFTKKTEITGYLKLRLWVAALDADDMDLHITLCKRNPLGFKEPGIPDMDPEANGYLRVSLRELDKEHSTEWNPKQTMAHSQKLAKKQIVPVDICIWPMGMLFGKGDQLQLKIEAHKISSIKNAPFASMFGKAKVSVPAESEPYTYDPKKDHPQMKVMGGNPEKVAPDGQYNIDHRMPQDVNHGRHAVYAGGEYDSYLLVPVIPPQK